MMTEAHRKNDGIILEIIDRQQGPEVPALVAGEVSAESRKLIDAVIAETRRSLALTNLLAHISTIEKAKVAVFTENLDLRTEIESLTVALSEAVRDTARLDWLEAMSDERFKNYDKITAPVMNLQPTGFNGFPTLREAIDALGVDTGKTE